MADTTIETPKTDAPQDETPKPRQAAAAPTVSQRQARFGATAGLYTIVFIAILVAINWLAREPRFNKTFDTTANKRFTLSDETQKIIKGLKGDATITYFDTKSGFSAAQALLDRYKNLSNKIQVQYVDVERQPTLARSYGVRTAGTAFVELAGRKEQAKTFDEEGLTGAFLKVLKGERTVCVIKGNGERPLEQSTADSLSFFKKLLERDNYAVQAVTLLDKTAVPQSCSVVVVAGPQNDYTANEVSDLKTYVENGGRAMFLLDPPLNFGREHIADNTGLTDLLASWGVTVDKDLVLEQNPMGQLVGVGPETPLVSDYQTHPIVNDLKEHVVGFQISRSLDIKNAPKTTVTKLFSTSDAAIADTNMTKQPDTISPADTRKGPFVLGAAGTYDTGKPSDPGRFVVIGNSSFVDDGGVAGIPFQSNRDLALNAINWLSSDEDLISIRPKEADNRTFSANASQMATFQYTVLFAIPLMIIVAGVSIYLKRR
jgi:ABC-type uncharacterized transport system involved in gliding motility auxiliary subunit